MQMQIRKARAEDGDEATDVVRRSITELCHADHQGDVATLSQWLANKTADTMRRWTDRHHVFLATEADVALGVGSMTSSGEVLLLYVSPDARFRGVSKGLLRRLEAQAVELGVEVVTLLSSATARSFYLSAGYVETGPPQKGFGITFGYPMAKRLSPSRPGRPQPEVES